MTPPAPPLQEGKLASQTVPITREAMPEPAAPDDLPATTDSTPAITEPEDDVAQDDAPQEAAPVSETAENAPVPDPVATDTPKPEETPEETAELADPSGLPLAPFEGLYQDTSQGRLPVVRTTDRLTPFQAYRRPFTPPVPVQPLVSVVITDIGLSDAASKAVMAEISPDVTVAVNPYANAPDVWVKESRVTGHEVWMELPVEPEFYPMDDPGPQTLLINAIERQNMNKLHWAMSRGTGYAGLLTGYKPVFMRSTNDARPVINEIYHRGLGFADGDHEKPSAVPSDIATGLNMPYARNHVWIDVPATAEHIAASLRHLEVLAQANGGAIGFMHSTPMGLRMLQDWVDGLGKKNIVLAPLSAQTNKAQ